ncbi:MAG: prepilin-type N-terminal cleavage/methylation domain-containing protein [Oscillospiraceae bacterium]|nr:prepilin-type N-terminal cleavage/methylation domain-containing protein [Oscillospiraceae bacterium]
MNKLRKTKRKGFTLIELIVVIVIIAILVAALTPAILGVINRANRSADEADARTILMAASVVTTSTNPPAVPTQAVFTPAMTTQLLGGSLRPGMAFSITFKGELAVTCTVTGGSRSDNTPQIVIGTNPAPPATDPGISVLTYTVP